MLRKAVDVLKPKLYKPFLVLCWVIIWFLLPDYSFAQEEQQDYLPFEFNAGLGYAHSFDNNLFNNNVPYRVKGGLGYTLAIRYYLDYNFSIGLKADGLYEIISDYPDDALGFFIEEDMHLSNVNVGIEGRYTVGNKRYQPFFGISAKYVYGDLSFEQAGFINGYRGFAFGGSGGIGYMVTNEFMLSLEGNVQSGWAKWQELPDFESINRNINPGMFSILLTGSFFFGELFQ